MAKYEIEIDVPEGYEPTGEFRYPRKGEHFVDGRGDLQRAAFDYGCIRHIILRKQWTPAPWMPKHVTLLRDSRGWRFFDGKYSVPAEALAAMYGETFDPPLHAWRVHL